jgi:hypothetical protein
MRAEQLISIGRNVASNSDNRRPCLLAEYFLAMPGRCLIISTVIEGQHLVSVENKGVSVASFIQC